MDPASLVVQARYDSQLNRSASHRELGRQQVAGIQRVAIGGNYVDLAGLVVAMDKTVLSSTTPPCSDLYDALVEDGPLHLHAKQLRTQIEDQVESFVPEGLVDAKPRPDRLKRNRLFSDEALVIRREHRSTVAILSDEPLPK
jgi:hypothetical protein